MKSLLFNLQNSVRPFYNSKIFSTVFLLLVGFSIFVTLLNNNSSNSSTESVTTFIQEPTEANDIPEVQVLVPGFSVKELPVSLDNINAIRYGTDGRLYALGYDGFIYVLTDSSGDGLEDKAEIWWNKERLIDPVGMVVSEEGIYVTSKNKLSLIKDEDKDGTADVEQIISKDWTKALVYTGTIGEAAGVDAFGIAKDKAGNLFFALGTADFTNAYSVDDEGKFHYDIKSERGTILKMAPGSDKREIYCSGTRFPVAMAFNEEGDLFATDQEGATCWRPGHCLPNGNPFDELLHIQQGRHYGFPPRNPKYLPDVIDEPSVFDYKPQHQSTCGLNFNLPVNNGATFGPSWWRGDAFLAGYSRGKIYRTKLVKTDAGYVAENSIFACLVSLTVDACISPKGDMVVSTHSGFPDWGFGPKAKGKLYKIIHNNTDLPNPVAAWTSNPDEVSIAFDKAVDKGYLKNLTEKISIKYGQYTQPGDRFEVVRPGYKTVERQLRFPVEKLEVKDAALSEDGRTLIISTFQHILPATYAITIPSFSNDEKLANSIKQSPTYDLAYTLNGVDATWQSASGGQKLNGWLPHLDMKVNKAFMEAVSGYNEMQKALIQPGSVTWKTQLNLLNMLRPESQPESPLDYKLPPEDVTLVLRSSETLQVKAGDLAIVSGSVKKGDLYETSITFNKVTRQAYPLEITMNTSSKEPVMLVHYYTNEDSRPRALQVHRFFVPWAGEIFEKETLGSEVEIAELAGGNWTRGRKLFFSEAMCASCHSIGGKGKEFGPDLSNLIFKDYKSVFRDIHEPSSAINPDYVGHTVVLKDKNEYTGLVSYKHDSVIIRDVAGNRTVIAVKEVDSTFAMPASLMPASLDLLLGKQKFKDLMTFLLSSMQPAPIENIFVPLPRKITEANDVLKNTNKINLEKKPQKILKVLWVSGPKDHGPDEHDYPLQQKRWSKLLSFADSIKVDTVSRWPTSLQFQNSDVVVFYWNFPNFTEQHGKQLDTFLNRGGGLVYLHYAVDATANAEALANRIGMAWKGGSATFRHGRQELDFSGNKHPITEGFEKTVFEDESYWQLTPGIKKINVLATGDENGTKIPMLWTTTQGKGRVFVSILGHYNWTFDDPLFRILLLRGIAWTGNQSTDRFNDLITIGARYGK